MKTFIQLLLWPFIGLFLAGCYGEDSGYFIPEEFYSLKDTLKSEILATPLDSYSTLYYTEYGILACTRTENRLFQLLDSTDASCITMAGRRGRGPGEFLSVAEMQYDYRMNRFSVYDMYKQEMATYEVSPDTIVLEKSVNLKRDLQRVNYINDSLLAFVNFYPFQKVGLMNSDAEVVYEEDCNILDDDDIQTTDRYFSLTMLVSPDKRYTVIADYNFAAVQVFMNKPDSLQLKWKKILFKPRYTRNAAKRWFILDNDHYYGFKSFYLTDKYIYLSCNDRQVIDDREKRPEPKHNYLLVMDYEGNIVNKYLMDKCFTSFAVSPDDKSLYATIEDPDVLIAKYAL